MKHKFLVVMTMLLVGLPSVAQKLYVVHQGDDFVGQRFAYAFKEQVRASTQYQAVDSEDDGITIKLLSLDVSPPGSAGSASAISVLVTLPADGGIAEYTLLHNILLVGSDRVTDMSSTLMAAVDKAISDTRAAIKQSLKTPQTQVVREH